MKISRTVNPDKKLPFNQWHTMIRRETNKRYGVTKRNIRAQ